jgi:hypothetical protein
VAIKLESKIHLHSEIPITFLKACGSHTHHPSAIHNRTHPSTTPNTHDIKDRHCKQQTGHPTMAATNEEYTKLHFTQFSLMI